MCNLQRLVEPRQRLFQQIGVVGIVFHQQNMKPAGAHRHVSLQFYNDLLFGRLTLYCREPISPTLPCPGRGLMLRQRGLETRNRRSVFRASSASDGVPPLDLQNLSTASEPPGRPCAEVDHGPFQPVSQVAQLLQIALFERCPHLWEQAVSFAEEAPYHVPDDLWLVETPLQGQLGIEDGNSGLGIGGGRD